MKKQLAILCAVLITVSNSSVYALEKEQVAFSSTFSQNTQSQSEVDPKKLETIILDVKNRIAIDDKDAEFFYQVSYEREMNTYLLNWNSSMYTTYLKYGEDKNIYEYYRYENKVKPDENIKKLPVYTKQESEKIALEFLKAALPTEYKNYKIRSEFGSLNQNVYYIYLDYYKDGLLFEGINGSIAVDGVKGEVINYYTNYNSKIKYDSKNGVISSKAAEEAYKNNIGIKPIYLTQYDEKGQIKEVKAVYVPKFDSSYVIDGKTGERISISQRYFITESDKVEGDLSTAPEKEPSLTEEEIKEIEKKQELKSISQAIEKIKSLGIPYLDSSSKLENAYLYESYNNTESGYIWSLSFSLENGSISVQLDAKNLELISFGNYDYNYKENTITQQQIIEAKAEAVKAVEKYSEIELSNLKLDEDYLETQIGNKSPVIYLNYVRIENGIEYPENGIWVSYDVLSKRVNSFSKNWYKNIAFQEVKLANKEIVYKQIFEENKQELKYKPMYTNGILTMGKLVYEVNQSNGQLPLIFDAITGKRIVQNIEIPKPITYSDISKSKYKEELEILIQLGIGFSGGELKPNQAIKQSEFLYLISQSFEFKPIPLDKIANFTSEERKSLEDILRQRGVLIGDEKLSDVEIKKEEAIKYLVRALGYEKIAKKSEIFVSNLRDFNKVTNSLKGYVAIGEALQIIEKNTVGQFLPSNKLPRDEALKMIYNYLK